MASFLIMNRHLVEHGLDSCKMSPIRLLNLDYVLEAIVGELLRVFVVAYLVEGHSDLAVLHVKSW